MFLMEYTYNIYSTTLTSITSVCSKLSSCWPSAFSNEQQNGPLSTIDYYNVHFHCKPFHPPRD